MFLVNTPTQVEYQLRSLEQAAVGIDFYVKANETDDICILITSSVSEKPLNSENHFTFICSNISISSIEYYVNIHLLETWIAINRLSIIWKYHVSDWINRIYSKM